jgi:protein gp37
MGKTRIEWATDTWPVITGCSPVSEGCRNCYAARLAATRLKHHPHYKGLATMVNGHPQWIGEVRFNADVLEQPLHWRKPRVVFVCSMSDLFHELVEVGDMMGIWRVMVEASQHIYLLLTKRPQEMRQFAAYLAKWLNYKQWPDHIWPGVTIETQDQVWRLQELVKIPAARLWASLEPLLGPIEIPPELLARLSGLVIGGESGPGASPMHPDWARSIRDQCVPAGVAFTFKQWGEWALESMLPEGPHGWLHFEKTRGFGIENPEGDTVVRLGKKAAGRELDGQIWDEFPWKLLRQEGAELGLGDPGKEG